MPGIKTLGVKYSGKHKGAKLGDVLDTYCLREMQAVDRQLDLGRSLQIWLNMQNGVNALFDSTSTPQNLGTQVWNNSMLHVART